MAAVSKTSSKTYKVQSNGKAPSGLSVGDKVVTGGGTYEITGVNSDGSYQSTKVDNTTTKTYTGSYTPTSSGSSSSGSSGGGSSNYSPTSSGSNYDKNVDYSALGTQQMLDGASWEDVMETYKARQAKAMGEEGLSQYINDDVQNRMLDYILNAKKEQTQEDYIDDFDYDVEKPTYEAQYDPAIQAMLDKILNRDDFSYNAQEDPLYQQYAAMYRQEGDRSASNTLAEAAASAGGMNSYAITAAQQANNYYNSQMANKIPELYQLAYEMYLQDKASMVEDLGLLQSMDTTQYNRYRDTMSDYYSDKNFAYGIYKDAVTQGNWQQNFDYNATVDDRNFNYGVTQDNITNDWNTKYWENTLSQQDYEKQKYEDTLKREEELRAKEEAQTQAYALLEMGQMPSSSLLAAAGIDEAYASAYLAGIKAELARQSASSSSSSSSSKKKETVDDTGYVGDDPVVDPETEKRKQAAEEVRKTGDVTKAYNYNDGSIIGLGLGVIGTELVEKLILAGAVVGDGNGHYRWADGWSANNYEERMKVTNPFFDRMLATM